MTTKLKRTLTAGTAVAVLAAAGAAVAGATGAGDDDARERPIPGAALAKARAAALAEVPGRATGTEIGDEEGYYEVEVTRADGSQVDVHLDRRFQILGTEDEGAGGHDAD